MPIYIAFAFSEEVKIVKYDKIGLSMHLSSKSSVGLTLIEMVVCISIFSVLFVIILASLQKAMSNAQAAGCAVNLNKLGGGIMLYAGEHNGTVPPSQNFITGQISADQWYRHNTMWAYQYIDQSWPTLGRIFKCPADKTKVDQPSNLINFYHSYTWSYDLLINWQDGVPRSPHTQYVKIWDVQKKILMLDGLCGGDGDSAYSSQANNLGTTGPLVSGSANMTISSRHNGGANCFFGDGSIQWISKSDLINTPSLWQY